MKKIIYRVEKKDTILSVANTFKVSPLYLIKLNRLNCEIQAGDLLVICDNATYCYQVKPFETLEQVLNKFCLSNSEFESLNGEIPYLFYGQTIAIPKKVK